MEKIKHLTKNNTSVSFFTDLKIGEIFTYSSIGIGSIKKSAAACNVLVEYCQPGSIEHEEHGCFIMKVVKPKPKTKQIIHKTFSPFSMNERTQDGNISDFLCSLESETDLISYNPLLSANGRLTVTIIAKVLK